jgi:hypothetical protein
MEKYIWSLDISTTNIGSTLWTYCGELVELKHLKLKTDRTISLNGRDIHKADVFRSFTLEYVKKVAEDMNGKIVETIVEEPLGGSNNAKTVSLLHGFNGMCRYVLYEIFGTFPLKISVHESRKAFCPELVKRKIVKGEEKETLSFPVEYRDDKKKYIWEKVARKHPEIKWLYKKNGDLCETSYDMSDSYCVGFAGLKQMNII